MRLLREHANRAFRERNDDYVGEVATKLRVLVVTTCRNQPLLIRLMRRTGIGVKVRMTDTKVEAAAQFDGGDWQGLEAYLQKDCIITADSHGTHTLKNVDVVRAIAEQAGGAHEDWKWDLTTKQLFFPPIRLNGLSIGAALLNQIANVVLAAGDEFLLQVDRCQAGKR